jgi:replication factor A1
MTVVNTQEAQNLREGINIEARIANKDSVREVNTKYGPSSVCTFTLEDDSGNILLNIWGEDIAKFGVGDTVRVANAYTSTFKGNVQLNVPKSGSVEKI